MPDALRRMALLVTVAALSLSAQGCYVLRQAAGQLEMFSSRRALSEVVSDPSLDARRRDGLRVAWFAREFALRELGLEASESYQSVVMLGRDSVSYVVAASPADRIEPYRWCFPVAGCLPYIGYFDRRDAVRERDRLRALGYDTQLRGVDAYSLGGWFPDPVYSPLLERTRGGIANTVIHELTHGTLFIPGEARFNESLATFVGDQGSLEFLSRRYGASSRTYRDALASQRDARRWERALRGLAEALNAVYASEIPRSAKLARKREILLATRRALSREPFETRAYRGRAARAELNNATLATFGTYFGDQALLARALRAHGGSLRQFVAFVRREVAPQRAPAAWLDRWTRARSARE